MSTHILVLLDHSLYSNFQLQVSRNNIHLSFQTKMENGHYFFPIRSLTLSAQFSLDIAVNCSELHNEMGLGHYCGGLYLQISVNLWSNHHLEDAKGSGRRRYRENYRRKRTHSY
ncbi:hypothetical protein AABB24_024724 [Solanum stoloniferum]|uniref:Uncharacterized protein n=1 Tax=Solanum stoloniferum TaxID=62892 RepID=A0ABD2SPW0_9SOLN